MLAGAALLLLGRQRRSTILGLAGTGSLAGGAFLPFPHAVKSLAVPGGSAILVAIAATALFILLPAGSSLRVRKWRRAGGMPAAGIAGTTVAELAPGEPGKVIIQGERFLAVSRLRVDGGMPIRVVGVLRGVLRVEPGKEECQMDSDCGGGGRPGGVR